MMEVAALAVVLGVVCAIVLTVLLYVYVIPESKNGKLGKFLQFLHDFFRFRKLYIEAILRFLYVLTTMLCICTGFFMLFGRTFFAGLALMILGPVVVRLAYELVMLVIILVTNVIAINRKIGREGGKTAEFVDENLK